MAEVYSDKTIRVTITLDSGKGAGTTMTFEGYACTVKVTKQGLPELPKASVTLWGLSEEHMENLTTLAFESMYLRRNRIVIEAGEKDKALATIFRGEIVSAIPDFNAAPSPSMAIEAKTGIYGAMTPAPPVAVKGNQSADSLCSAFAKEAGMKYRSSGITASVGDCVINGDPVTKMKWVAETIGADLVIDDDEVTLLERDTVRGQSAAGITIINPQTGQIGYPSFDDKGVKCTVFFEPSLQIMGMVEIQSAFRRANGKWRIYSLSHDLSANLPSGGSWKTEISCSWLYKMLG